MDVHLLKVTSQQLIVNGLSGILGIHVKSLVVVVSKLGRGRSKLSLLVGEVSVLAPEWKWNHATVKSVLVHRC